MPIDDQPHFGADNVVPLVVPTPPKPAGPLSEDDLAAAREVALEFGDIDLINLMNTAKHGGYLLGNHPAMIRVFVKIAKALAAKTPEPPAA